MTNQTITPLDFIPNNNLDAADESGEDTEVEEAVKEDSKVKPEVVLFGEQ